MKTFLTLLLLLATFVVNAQYDPNYKNNLPEESSGWFNVGLGIGIDYGMFGVKASGYPIDHVGLFAGAGYNMVGIGFNIGGIGRILPGKKVCPYLTAMYGNNAVIKVIDATQYDKAYMGPTFGAGIELHFKSNQNFMNFGLLVPIRSQEFYNDWDVIKAIPGMESSDLLPVGISIGYHFTLQTQD